MDGANGGGLQWVGAALSALPCADGRCALHSDVFVLVCAEHVRGRCVGVSVSGTQRQRGELGWVIGGGNRRGQRDADPTQSDRPTVVILMLIGSEWHSLPACVLLVEQRAASFPAPAADGTCGPMERRAAGRPAQRSDVGSLCVRCPTVPADRPSTHDHCAHIQHT